MGSNPKSLVTAHWVPTKVHTTLLAGSRQTLVTCTCRLGFGRRRWSPPAGARGFRAPPRILVQHGPGGAALASCGAALRAHGFKQLRRTTATGNCHMSFASYPSLKLAVVFVTRGASGIGAVVVDPEMPPRPVRCRAGPASRRRAVPLRRRDRHRPPACRRPGRPAGPINDPRPKGRGIAEVSQSPAHGEQDVGLAGASDERRKRRGKRPAGILRGRSRAHRGAGNRRPRATSALIRSRSRQQ